MQLQRRRNKVIGAGFFELAAAAIAPKHPEGADTVGMGTHDVISAISNHDAVLCPQSMLGQYVGDQLGLVIQRPIGLRAMDTIKKVGHAEMLKDAAGEDNSLRRREE